MNEKNAQEQAEGMLVAKPEPYVENFDGEAFTEREVKIFNWLHDIATPILAKKILECEELEKMLKMKQDDWLEVCKENDKLQLRIEELKKVLKYCKERVEELEAEAKLGNIPYKEAVKLKKELQSAKERIEKLEEENTLMSDSCDAEKVYKLESELQSLKSKLTVENLDKIAERIGDFQCLYDFIKALLKDLGVKG